jgi:hypothetical protein
MQQIDTCNNTQANQKLASIIRGWLADKRTHSTVNVTASAGARALKEILVTERINYTALDIICDNLESIDQTTRAEAKTICSAISSKKCMLAQLSQLA